MEDLCIDFLNSRCAVHSTGEIEDRLPRPEWRRGFLDRNGLELARDVELPLQELARGRAEVRGILETWAAGEVVAAADLARLDSLLSASPGRLRLTTGSGGRPAPVFTPDRRDWRWVLAEVAASAVRLMMAGEPRRLKRCGNPDCTWLFYDLSHNASRRWCDVRACGNLVKVREFRARQRVAAG